MIVSIFKRVRMSISRRLEQIAENIERNDNLDIVKRLSQRWIGTDIDNDKWWWSLLDGIWINDSSARYTRHFDVKCPEVKYYGTISTRAYSYAVAIYIQSYKANHFKTAGDFDNYFKHLKKKAHIESTMLTRLSKDSIIEVYKFLGKIK